MELIIVLWYFIISNLVSPALKYFNITKRFLDSSIIGYVKFIIVILLCVTILLYRLWIFTLLFSQSWSFEIFLIWTMNLLILISLARQILKLLVSLIVICPFIGDMGDSIKTLAILLTAESLLFSIISIYSYSIIRIIYHVQIIAVVSGYLISKFILDYNFDF